jgi:glycosyltransferase involved in cell wall biosynthesis
MVNRNAKVLMLTQTDKTHIKGSTFLFKLNIHLFKRLGVYAFLTPIKANYEAFKKVGIDKVFYLPFVYPVSHFSTKGLCSPVKILCIGKYVQRKKQLLLLQILKNLRQHFKIFLSLYGEPADSKYFEQLNSYVTKNNLNNFVEIKKNVSYREITALYKKYDLFVLPAEKEPAAFSIVEAMAWGLPVICSAGNGTACYIKNGKNGQVFSENNAADLEAKIRSVISDPETYQNMSKNAYKFALLNHSPDKFIKSIEAVLYDEN